MKVVVAPSAREDLLGIWAFIAKDNVAAADKVCERIYDSFEQLAHSPYLGESCTDMGLALRRYVVGSYVIFYAVAEAISGVTVKAVIHGARDLSTELVRRGMA